MAVQGQLPQASGDNHMHKGDHILQARRVWDRKRRQDVPTSVPSGMLATHFLQEGFSLRVTWAGLLGLPQTTLVAGDSVGHLSLWAFLLHLLLP